MECKLGVCRALLKMPKCRREWKLLLGLSGLISLPFFLFSNQIPDEPDFHHRVLKHRSACSAFPESCHLTAPFIFDSVHALLKQWPNTYASNGHSIVPAIVPTNVQLYHAQSLP